VLQTPRSTSTAIVSVTHIGQVIRVRTGRADVIQSAVPVTAHWLQIVTFASQMLIGIFSAFVYVMKIMLDQIVRHGLALASILVILVQDLMPVIAPTALLTLITQKMAKHANAMTTGLARDARIM